MGSLLTSSPVSRLWLRSSARCLFAATEPSISLAKRSASSREMPIFVGSSLVVYRFSSQVDLTCSSSTSDCHHSDCIASHARRITCKALLCCKELRCQQSATACEAWMEGPPPETFSGLFRIDPSDLIGPLYQQACRDSCLPATLPVPTF